MHICFRPIWSMIITLQSSEEARDGIYQWRLHACLQAYSNVLCVCVFVCFHINKESDKTMNKIWQICFRYVCVCYYYMFLLVRLMMCARKEERNQQPTTKIETTILVKSEYFFLSIGSGKPLHSHVLESMNNKATQRFSHVSRYKFLINFANFYDVNCVRDDVRSSSFEYKIWI